MGGQTGHRTFLTWKEYGPERPMVIATLPMVPHGAGGQGTYN